MPKTSEGRAGRAAFALLAPRTATVLTVLSLTAACGGSGKGGTTPAAPSGQNRPPTAGAITVSPTGTGMAGATSFSFTADGAQDPDGNSLSFSWTFGDEGTGTGATVTHTYGSTGSFAVSLSVSDGTVTVTAPGATVTVAPNLATPAWGGNAVGQIGQNNCGFPGAPACKDVPQKPSLEVSVLKLQLNDSTLTGTLAFRGTCKDGSLAAFQLKGTVASLTHPARVQFTTSASECPGGPNKGPNNDYWEFTLQTNASGTVLSGTVIDILSPPCALGNLCRVLVPGPITFERCPGASAGAAFACRGFKS